MTLIAAAARVAVPAVHDAAVARTLTDIAATDDPRRVIALAEVVLDEAKASYLTAMTAVADRLIALKADLDRAAAVDVLWFYLGRPGWYTLVGDRGWDFDRAEAWLADAAKRALLTTP